MEDIRFPGALSLTEELDQLVLLIMRDGRHIVGRLASLDQHSNVVLEDAQEWFIYGDKFATEQLDLFVVKSDNVVLISSFDESKASSVKLKKIDRESLYKVRNEDKSGVGIQKELWSFDKR